MTLDEAIANNVRVESKRRFPDPAIDPLTPEARQRSTDVDGTPVVINGQLWRFAETMAAPLNPDGHTEDDVRFVAGELLGQHYELTNEECCRLIYSLPYPVVEHVVVSAIRAEALDTWLAAAAELVKFKPKPAA